MHDKLKEKKKSKTVTHKNQAPGSSLVGRQK